MAGQRLPGRETDAPCCRHIPASRSIGVASCSSTTSPRGTRVCTANPQTYRKSAGERTYPGVWPNKSSIAPHSQEGKQMSKRSVLGMSIVESEGFRSFHVPVGRSAVAPSHPLSCCVAIDHSRVYSSTAHPCVRSHLCCCRRQAQRELHLHSSSNSNVATSSMCKCLDCVLQ